MKKLSSILSAFFLSILVLFSQTTNKLKVQLAWDRNPEPDIMNYIVYAGTNSGIYQFVYHAGNNTNYTITNLVEENKIFYFVVTAVNTAGLESDFSKQISLGSTQNYTNLTAYEASEITTNSARLTLRVLLGTTNYVNSWFRYGNSPTNMTTRIGQDDLLPSPNGELIYSVNLTNLTAPTYYYRAFVWMWTNGIGIYSTPIAQFDLVQPPQLPDAPVELKIDKVEEVVQ